ncbi:MAG: hypothetical protein QM763_20690 [Agriterribacter sp.]
MARVSLLLIILLLSVAAFISCLKSSGSGCHYVDIPASLFFLPKHDGERLSDDVLNTITISYMDNGSKKKVTDVMRATEEGRALGVMTTRDIGALSADHNIKTFYIEYTSLPTDTIYVDYSPPNPSTGCIYARNLVKYNNQTVLPDPAITAQTVYVFNKP